MSIEAKLISDLLRLADACIASNSRWRLALISYYVMGRTKRLDQFRRGIPGPRLTAYEYDQARQSFSDNWPVGVPWPDAIDRPLQSAPAKRSIWPQPRRRLTEQERIDMVEAYKRGDPLSEICQRFDVDHSYPTQMARRRGVELRTPS